MSGPPVNTAVTRTREFAAAVLPDGGGPRPRPTIRNVAERAGVSKSLVSLVLRGSPHVSEHRRQAVLQAARDLGYRPNAVARSLVEGRTHLVGALVADLHNPFYAEFLDGLQESLHGDGLRLLIGNSQWDPAFEDEAVEAFLELRVDGLVLLGIPPTSETLIEATGYTPMVVVGEHDIDLGGVDVVVDDDRLGARLAIDHLVELGHRRIAHIEGTRSSSGRSRCEGYLVAMRRHALAPYIMVEQGDPTEEGGARAARSLLTRDPRPTAVFAANDMVAMGVLAAAAELGLRVPEDLSVVGYDNTHLAGVPAISLTTVDQPRRAMGRSAAALLSDRIGDPRKASRLRQVTPELVVRRSTGPAGA
ncbi:LacI family DNA-binding transcriptional regulator [Planomonospora parontospora]|uniref:LacI family DNA-binding transcriptional regulator n=1 Tax=Planomonospora parontospora TaxID=58119 RepID=UPI001941A86E|nr:LacI family DNA-binding transcriptional regulator [Planomonospora parontospora]GGL48729.1 LacI family transcriptional regulator [Planomonospora parontospora subsp. antibiotica]GII18865.1 LacI family transcriptional regulator [Planomonospora parontospora subsp. antibiotica]